MIGIVEIFLSLIFVGILGFFGLIVRNNRERDQDIVARQTGGGDATDWWTTFSEPGQVLRKDEKERLSTPHDLQQHKTGSNKDLPVDFVGWKISLCYNNRTDPFPHKHYFVQLTNMESNAQQEWKLDFSLNPHNNKGEVSFVKSFKPLECITESTETRVTDGLITRIVSVICATNFSYCLRNSEHFSRYIYEGTWQSYQLTQNKYMRTIFEKILTTDDRKRIATLPTDIQAKQSKNAVIMYAELTGMLQFKNRSKLDGFKLPKDAYNIIVVGPTGSGKSSLINFLFNLTVCETADNEQANFASVTRGSQVLSGVHHCKDGEVPVNIIDTMGMCDNYLENSEALENLYNGIISDHSKVDRVVCMTYGTISKAHQEAMVSLLDRLQYPRVEAFRFNDSKDIHLKRNNFLFLYNKTEKMSEDEKLNKLNEMGKILSVDIGHKIPVEMLMPGMEDTGMETTAFFKAGLATGINTNGKFDAATEKTAKELKAVLLPHTRKALLSPERLNISECCIQ